MVNMEVLVVKHDELMLKGKLYSTLENMLVKDIRRALSISGKKYKIRKERGRIYVYSDKEAFDVLKRVFGIYSVSFGYEEESYEKLLEKLKKSLDRNFTYKLEVRRANKKFGKSSIEIAKDIAGFLEKEGIKVGVKKFDKKINIEIRDKFYALIKEEKGVGGFPYGFEDKAILLFSGGFDSSLVFFLSAKQGIKPILLSVVPSYEIKERVEKIVEKIAEKYFIRYEILFYRMPVGLIELKEELRQVSLKRFLYLLAEKVAKEKKAKAIITGEVIGQTHSQRMENLKVIEKGIEFPVLRPLCFLSKNEIVERVREIGVYEECSSLPEFCALSKKVKTKVREEELEEEKIRKMVENIEGVEMVEKGEEGERIPLYLYKKEDLKKVLEHRLDKRKKYVLVCKTGTMASLFSEELRKHGFDVIAKKEGE